jgi:hypothetical protein
MFAFKGKYICNQLYEKVHHPCSHAEGNYVEGNDQL